MKIAYRQQRPSFPGLRTPTSERCPHCGQPDSGGHILGGCIKPIFKAMYIHRHDLALIRRHARHAFNAISKDHRGGYYTIADNGRAEVIGDMGVTSKRFPAWLLPNSCLSVARIDPKGKNRTRPDIMLTEMTHTERMSYSTGGVEHPELSTTINGLRPSGSMGPQRRKVWVPEGGYTADTRHVDKVEEKQSQHDQLMHALQVTNSKLEVSMPS